MSHEQELAEEEQAGGWISTLSYNSEDSSLTLSQLQTEYLCDWDPFITDIFTVILCTSLEGTLADS